MIKLINENVQHSLQFNVNPVSISVKFTVKFNHNSDLTLFHLKVSDTGGQGPTQRERIFCNLNWTNAI